MCVGACGDDSDGSGGGAASLTCTTEAPPSVSCDGPSDPSVARGTTCVAESDSGGCPNLAVTWLCTGTEGGSGWVPDRDTHCDCEAQGTTDACNALPGCGWRTPEGCGDPGLLEFGAVITVAGCYDVGCGYGNWGFDGTSCEPGICGGVAPTSSAGTGGGGEGGGAPLTCTTDEPPAEGCSSMGVTNGHCEIELEGGCPTTTVAWDCVGGEGGVGWERTENTHCDCTGDGVDEAACSELPGCAWAAPDPATCNVEEAGSLIDGEGCYRTQCGFGGWGVVDGVCRYDLCRSGG